MSGISALIKDTPGTPLPPHSCENTESKWPFVNQEWGSYQTPNLIMPWSWAPQPPELGEINVCCLTHPVYGIFV